MKGGKEEGRCKNESYVTSKIQIQRNKENRSSLSIGEDVFFYDDTDEYRTHPAITFLGEIRSHFLRRNYLLICQRLDLSFEAIGAMRFGVSQGLPQGLFPI